MYPNRFYLLGEIEINKSISAMTQEQKTGKVAITQRINSNDNAEWRNNIEKMVIQRWKEAPKVWSADFKTLIGDDPWTWPIDIPTLRGEDGIPATQMKKVKNIIIKVKT